MLQNINILALLMVSSNIFKTFYRWTTSIEPWHWAYFNHRQCYWV